MSEPFKDERDSLQFRDSLSSTHQSVHILRRFGTMSPHTMSLSPCTRVVPCKKRPWLPPSPSSCSDDDDTPSQDIIVEVPQDLHLSPRANSPPPPPVTRHLSDFSIERILSDIPVSRGQVYDQTPTRTTIPGNTFDWLHCTRYRPPKLPRSRRRDSEGGGGVRRRRPGRGPRIPFAPWQVDVLEKRFQHGAYLGAGDVASLATTLGLADTRVKIWFQNRRARERRDGQATLNNAKPCTTQTPEKNSSTRQPSPPPIVALGSADGSAFTVIRPVGLNVEPCR